MRQISEIDPALRLAADAQQIPGVVAMAATSREVRYAWRRERPRRHAEPHFTAEKLVGFRNWFENVCTSGPFFSVSPRFAIHSGSVENAAHFFSRSAIDS